jgi:Protein of unknown function (DUF3105)
VRLAAALEWLAIAVASLALSIGLIAVLSGFFAGRDKAGIAGSPPQLGAQFADLGDAHLRPGQPRPPYDSDPPTSGAHVPVPVTHDRAALSDDQLLEALALGDVVVMYPTSKPPPGLRRLEQSVVAAPFTPALAAQGEALILARRPGIQGVVGLAWTHMLQVASAADPRLRQFAEYWLGRGAPGHRR